MPSYEIGYGYKNNGDRRKAWIAHFISIGCHPVQADRLASDRCWKNGKWPQAKAAA